MNKKLLKSLAAAKAASYMDTIMHQSKDLAQDAPSVYFKVFNDLLDACSITPEGLQMCYFLHTKKMGLVGDSANNVIDRFTQAAANTKMTHSEFVALIDAVFPGDE